MSGNTDWSVAVSNLVKVEVNDLSGTLYDPEEYQKIIYNAAFQVVADLNELYSVAYIVDNVGLTITPDPETSIESGKDVVFMSLVALKASCMIEMAKYSDSLGQTIRIKDGDSSIDTSVRAGARRDSLNAKSSPCARYIESLLLAKTGNTGSSARFVVDPTWDGNSGRWVSEGGYTTYSNRNRSGSNTRGGSNT